MTPEESILIAKYLWFYRQLDTGERAPTTDGQRHFVAVCRGEMRPLTEHEFAYLAYKSEEPQRRQELAARLAAKRSAVPELEGEAARKKDRARADRANRDAKRKKALKQIERRATDRDHTVPIHEIDPRAAAPWAAYVEEPIGSRDDFKKDRGRNWSRAKTPK